MKKLLILSTLFFVLASCWNNISNNVIENTSKINTENSQNIQGTTLISVSALEFKKELDKKKWTLIDLRTPWEVSEWIIPWAKQIDFYSPDFKDKISKLDKNNKYLIYCRSWARSGKTLNLMKTLGFTNVIELQWWMNNWITSWEKTAAFSNKSNIDMMMNDEVDSDDMMNNMMPKTVTLNAKKWEFDQKIIKAKKWEKLIIKVNNVDWLHWIAIPDMRIMDDNEIEVDTSKAWEYEFRCLNYCWDGHQDMTWTIIIE